MDTSEPDGHTRRGPCAQGRVKGWHTSEASRSIDSFIFRPTCESNTNESVSSENAEVRNKRPNPTRHTTGQERNAHRLQLVVQRAAQVAVLQLYTQSQHTMRKDNIEQPAAANNQKA